MTNPHSAPFVLFDDAVARSAFVLEGFVRQDILSPAELDNLDGCLKNGWAQHLHCALFADYEFGYPLHKLPERFSGSLTLLWFRHKTDIADTEGWLERHGSDQPAGISTPELNVSAAQYRQEIAQIHEAVRRGETYQINHTLRLTCAAYGSPLRLYHRLRQTVPYAALAHWPNGAWTLCFSPELFLRLDADGRLLSEPMKGTAPILHDGRDAERAEALRQDAKNRAENTMIVDLLRNDLGKLAEIGGVSVPKRFEVRPFGQVWQMTSQIQARLKANTTAADILRAAFPCGSITGAPKRKSMEIIAALEPSPRGLYTGSIGYLQAAPESPLGFSGCLNVVIRTLELKPPQNGIYSGTYGVGSGIVIDSRAEDEFAECGWKARFLTGLRPEFGLIETLRAENGRIEWQTDHLTRMAASAHALNIPFARNEAEALLAECLNGAAATGTHRLRLELSPEGGLSLIHAPLPDLPNSQTVLISPEILPRQDVLRRHKTTRREVFDRAWQAAAAQGAFDALFFNEDGFLLEGGRSSVIIRHQGRWLTPDPALDILPGIALSKSSLNPAPALITRNMLAEAETLLLGNALRGWFAVRLLE